MVVFTLWSFLVLSRAHFLAGGVPMYALGAVIARADGASLPLSRLVWGQVGVSAIQLMTHFVNEYHDAARDGLVTTRTLFSGGSGVLPSGRLGRRIALGGAVICALVGVAATLTIGWPVTLVYSAGLMVGYVYSAPPLRLMTRGWGKLAAASVVAFLTPLAGYGVAAGRLSASVIWPGLPLLALSAAFMILVELPDYEADRPTGKRNWVVCWGRRRAGTVHNELLLSCYISLALLEIIGALPSAVSALLWLTLPLAVWQICGVWFRFQYGILTGGGLALIRLYGLLAGLGYWV